MIEECIKRKKEIIQRKKVLEEGKIRLNIKSTIEEWTRQKQ